jgi:hypothetical protein
MLIRSLLVGPHVLYLERMDGCMVVVSAALWRWRNRGSAPRRTQFVRWWLQTLTATASLAPGTFPGGTVRAACTPIKMRCYLPPTSWMCKRAAIALLGVRCCHPHGKTYRPGSVVASSGHVSGVMDPMTAECRAKLEHGLQLLATASPKS